MSKVSQNLDALASGWVAFQREWRSTREQWRDSVGDRFSKRFWEEWEKQLPNLLEALSELDQAMEESETMLRQSGGG